MNFTKNQIVSINQIQFNKKYKPTTPRFLQHFLFICQHDAGCCEKIKVKVFCHKEFRTRISNFRKNELKDVEYIFDGSILVG